MDRNTGDNVTTKYLENPYFDGVVSAITTQSETTLNCRAEHTEIAQRRANMGKAAARARSYPGGEVLDNLHIMPHELVFGWVNRQGRNQIPGHPNQIGFSSLNGLKWGDYSTDEELELRLRFIGLAKTPFIFDNINQLKHGFTCIGSGSGTSFHTGEEDIFPGDKLYWSVIPRPHSGSDVYEGGKFGDSGPGSRQGNPVIGTPRGKLRFRINPARFNDSRPSLNAAVSAMKKTSDVQGVADRPYEHLFSDVSFGKGGSGPVKPTPLQEFAIALEKTNAVTVIRGIRSLQKSLAAGELPGVVDLTTVTEVQLCDAMGVFKTNMNERRACMRLIDNLYLQIAGNAQASRLALGALRTEIPSGFDTRTNRPKRNTSTASRYVQVACNMGNLQLTAFQRAAHFSGRKRFATALSYAKKGQRVDMLIGHFLEAF